jgi:hypothetical protein
MNGDFAFWLFTCLLHHGGSSFNQDDEDDGVILDDFHVVNVNEKVYLRHL